MRVFLDLQVCLRVDRPAMSVRPVPERGVIFSENPEHWIESQFSAWAWDLENKHISTVETAVQWTGLIAPSGSMTGSQAIFLFEGWLPWLPAIHGNRSTGPAMEQAYPS